MAKAKSTCSVADCDRPAKARGWCYTHYARWRAHGDVGLARPVGSYRAEPAKCKVAGCEGRSQCRGMCSRHYQQWRKGILEARECKTLGCNCKARYDGFCGRHRSTRRIEEASNERKVCSTCGESKSLDAFTHDPRYPDRRVSRCKKCTCKSQRDISFRRRYVIGLDAVEAMAAAQGRRCAICGRKEDLVVDHDHATGHVRGLLCQACNRGLGCVHDNSQILAAMIDYLHEHSSEPDSDD